MRYENAVVEAQQWRTYVKAEENADKNWNYKLGFIVDVYRDMFEKFNEISKRAILPDVPKEIDNRKIKIPVTHNKQYGWISDLEEFKLQKYGPDYDRGLPLPDIYRLLTEPPK